MKNTASSNEKSQMYAELKRGLQRDRREHRLYIRLTKDEKQRLRQIAERVDMPLGEYVLNVALAYTKYYEEMVEKEAS